VGVDRRQASPARSDEATRLVDTKAYEYLRTRKSQMAEIDRIRAQQNAARAMQETVYCPACHKPIGPGPIHFCDT
jgi:hypothetical protein